MRRSVTKSIRAEAQPVEQSVVTELRPLASDPNMRQVRVGRRCVATLRAADVESLGIVPGTAWTEQLCQRVQEAAALNRARRQAMTLLGRRQLSRGELIDRLTRKNHPPAMAQRIADELAADRWIDDEAFGRALADEITRRKPASQQLVASKLHSRRIEPELAAEIARETVRANSPENAALDMARRRLGTMRNLPKAVAQRRIAGMLSRRGFDDDLVQSVLDRLDLAHDEGSE